MRFINIRSIDELIRISSNDILYRIYINDQGQWDEGSYTGILYKRLESAYKAAIEAVKERAPGFGHPLQAADIKPIEEVVREMSSNGVSNVISDIEGDDETSDAISSLVWIENYNVTIVE